MRCRVAIAWNPLTSCSGGTWGRKMAPPASTAVVVDGNGVFVTGGFRDTAHFGSSALTSRGDEDVFVASYSTDDGTLRWVVQAGGPELDVGAGIAIYPDGTLGVAGIYRDHAYFGQTKLTALGMTDAFVWRLRPPTTSTP